MLLLLGTLVYSTVFAVSGAGLKSAIQASNGYLIDCSAPEAVHKFTFSDNLVENPSFEDVEEGEEGESVPLGWTIDGDTRVSTGQGSQSGRNYLVMDSGYIKQVVPTEGKAKHRLTFDVAAPSSRGGSFQSAVAYVTIGDLHSSFGPSQALQEYTSTTHWQRHVYFFTGDTNNSTLTLGLLKKRATIWLDSVDIVSLDYGKRPHSEGNGDPSGQRVEPVHVHLTTLGQLVTVSASWDVQDPESPVTSFWWAVGTVKGKQDD